MSASPAQLIGNSPAMAFYEAEQAGLGLRFVAGVEAAVARIRQNPTTWAKLSGRLRRCLLHRFPFALFYSIANDEIRIVAVADLRRDPKRWEELL